jgi:hypothetical protein
MDAALPDPLSRRVELHSSPPYHGEDGLDVCLYRRRRFLGSDGTGARLVRRAQDGLRPLSLALDGHRRSRNGRQRSCRRRSGSDTSPKQ